MVTLAAAVNATQRIWQVDARLPSGTRFVKAEEELVEILSGPLRYQQTSPLFLPLRYHVKRGVSGARASHAQGTTLTRYFNQFGTAELDTGGNGSLTVTDGVTTATADTLQLPAGTVSDEGGGLVVAFPLVITENEEPAATSPALLWLRKTDDGTSYQLYVRPSTDDAWLLASAGLGGPDYGDGYHDDIDRQVGHFNPNYGAVQGLEVQGSGGSYNVFLRSISGDGNDSMIIAMNPTALFLQGLPTSDPHVATQLFTDGVPGVGSPVALKVSGG